MRHWNNHEYPHGGPGREWGRGGGRDRMERGALRLLVLDALQSGPKHGYEIIKATETRTNGQYAPSPGTIYPTLQLLEDEGLIAATQDSERRVFAITETGQKELATYAERIEAFWNRFAQSNIAPGSRHEIAFLEEELEALTQTVWRGLRTAVGRDDRELVKRIRRTLQDCREDVRTLLAESDSANPSTSDQA